MLSTWWARTPPGGFRLRGHFRCRGFLEAAATAAGVNTSIIFIHGGPGHWQEEKGVRLSSANHQLSAYADVAIALAMQQSKVAQPISPVFRRSAGAPMHIPHSRHCPLLPLQTCQCQANKQPASPQPTAPRRCPSSRPSSPTHPSPHPPRQRRRSIAHGTTPSTSPQRMKPLASARDTAW